MDLKFYNTLTRTKETFVPIDPANVRMYVCGPTVYDYAHIGNARPAIVFDVLFRLLRHVYGEDHVTYARNITDVDDKIIERAARDGVSIDELTKTTADQYHADVEALGCLKPTFEPRATKHIGDMIAMIGKLIERGHAYAADGHVLFDTASMPDYGKLAKRSLDEMISGARVEVASYKKNATDFVLWKPSAEDQPGWESPWGRGRPGWHIECSAMSAALLGETFDIHGGGIDLAFPHHENEVAQSRCAHGTPVMANVWMHNGFLQVEGQKMSKSLGNFITINDLLRTETFGGRKWDGPVLRLAMLMTHYREPIDFSVHRLEEAEFIHDRLSEVAHERTERAVDLVLNEELESLLFNDMDTPGLIGVINSVSKKSKISTREVYTIYKYCRILGIKFPKGKIAKLADKAASLLSDIEALRSEQRQDLIELGVRKPYFRSGRLRPEAELMRAIGALSRLLPNRPRPETIEKHARQMRDELAHQQEIKRGSTKKLLTFLEFLSAHREHEKWISESIQRRLAARAEKNWAEADRIRDELLEKGIQLKDGKDPQTGAPVTTWEVVR